MIMFTETQFLSLVQRVEDETLDFKREAYDLSREDKRFAVVKDVLCMANTPRDDASYIILGVKKFPDGKFDLVGINSHVDEADLQSQFSERIYPVPRFRYDPVSYSGKDYGIITILPERLGPCVPLRDYGNALRRHQVYFRRGSKNDVAGPQDLIRIINWIKPNYTPSDFVSDLETEVPAWAEFMNSAHHFAKHRRYILVANIPDVHIGDNSEMLATVDWSFVVDLDPRSDMDGLLQAILPKMEARRSVHRLVKGERPTFNLDRGTYWFFARGLEGSAQPPTLGTWREWRQEYGNELKEQTDSVAKASTPTPVTVVALWYGEGMSEHLRSVLDGFLAAYGTAVDFVIATDNPADIDAVAATMDSEVTAIPLHHICFGLEWCFVTPDNSHPDLTVLPSSSGAPIHVDADSANWLEEEIELVHLNAGLVEDEERDVGGAFLKGNEITWYELGLRYDVERDRSRQLFRRLDRDLASRRGVRIDLFHQPGAGGTTVARRVIWDLHQTYPCGILRSTEPRETIERLQHIVNVTGQSVVLLADSRDVSGHDLDELFEYVKARHLPVVIFQVVRIFGNQSSSERAIFLDSQLTPGECQRFAHILSRAAPQRSSGLAGIAGNHVDRFRTPFYYCLQAFGEDFVGLDAFVSVRLNELTDVQKRILGYLSIAHHYGHKSVSSHAFGAMLGIPAHHSVDLSASLSEKGLDLVVETGNSEWRTSHDLISTEILRHLLSLGAADTALWRQNLSKWSIEFAGFCRGSGPIPSESMLEVARRTFVYRDNVELLGTERSGTLQFAQLIRDIPVTEGRVEVLHALTEAYPDEAHFWAHFGRFFAIEMRDHQRSLECVDRALTLQPEDSVLHHMKGMALRSRTIDLIGERTDLTEVVRTAKAASDSFEKARDRNPDDEHGYISEVQLLSRVLDYAGTQHNHGLTEYLLSPLADPYVQSSLGRSEDLLEQVRRNREGQGPSSFEQECRGRLDSIYGEHDRALQVWDNLLQRQDVYFPPIRRQIVWTYLARKARSWEALSERELARANELLEHNLDQEPYNERDMRMWIQAVRRLPHTPSIESVIEKVAYWQANSGSIDSTYYLYVLNAILAIEGSVFAADSARQHLEECRGRSRLRRNRTKSFEWLGPGVGLPKLVHHSRLGDWDHSSDYWTNIRPLSRVTGRIARIQGSHAGYIEVAGGLTAFFVPAKSGYARGRSENQAVEFHLGFSYDGLRAWDVSSV